MLNTVIEYTALSCSDLQLTVEGVKSVVGELNEQTTTTLLYRYRKSKNLLTERQRYSYKVTQFKRIED